MIGNVALVTRKPKVSDPDVPTTAAALLAAAAGEEIPAWERPETPTERYEGRPRMPPGHRKPKGKELGKTELRGKVVGMRIAGVPYAEIGEACGINPNTAAKYVDQWVIEQKPATDQVDNLRAVMQARLEMLHGQYWHLAMGYAKGEEEPRVDRYGEVVGPDPKAGEFLIKIMDRQAKLMGVDLQPNTTTMLISAESIAIFLGWDDAPPPQAAKQLAALSPLVEPSIDVEAEEV